MDITLAEQLATDLIAEYLPYPWSFRWDHAKTRFGQCNYTHRTIQLSKPLTATNTESEVLDTILHEIAHALTPGHGHDAVWSRKATELGANGQRCSKQTKGISYKYAGWCRDCGQLISVAHRRSRAMQAQQYIHIGCGGRIQYLRNVADYTKSDRGNVVKDRG